MKVFHETIQRAWTESLSYRPFDLPVFDCPYHQHQEIEVLRIDQSEGTVLAGDHVDRFCPGQVYVFGSMLPHAFINASGTQRAMSVCVQFDPEIFSETVARIPEFNMLNDLFDRVRRGWLLTGTLMEEASFSLERIAESHGINRILELLKFLGRLADSKDYRILASDCYDWTRAERHVARLEKALTYIHEVSASDLKIPELAKRVGMSESAFHRFFRQRMGCSPGAYIIKLRLANSARSLIESDDSIARIAFDAGFNNLSNFNRRFMKEFKCSPSAYRKKMMIVEDDAPQQPLP